MIKEYMENIYTKKYIEFDDAWHDDGLSYSETLVDDFTENDWQELNRKINSFNDATNLRVAESLSDVCSQESIDILFELLTLVQSVKILEEIATILYTLLNENDGIEIVFTKEKWSKLKTLEEKSFILSTYIGGVLKKCH